MKPILYLVAVFVTVPLTVVLSLLLVGTGLRKGVFAQQDLFALLVLLAGASAYAIAWNAVFSPLPP
jgi:hypothetical protein